MSWDWSSSSSDDEKPHDLPNQADDEGQQPLQQAPDEEQQPHHDVADEAHPPPRQATVCRWLRLAYRLLLRRQVVKGLEDAAEPPQGSSSVHVH